ALFVLCRRPPSPPLFPSTTLFRSRPVQRIARKQRGLGRRTPWILRGGQPDSDLHTIIVRQKKPNSDSTARAVIRHSYGNQLQPSAGRPPDLRAGPWRPVPEVPSSIPSDHNAAIQRITSADESAGTGRHSNPIVPSERFTHTRAATFPRPSVRTSKPYARSSVAV